MPLPEEMAGPLIPDPRCRAEIGADTAKWARWERTLAGFPPVVVVKGRKHRRAGQWTPFRDRLLAGGDGSVTHSPRMYRKAEEAAP